MYEKQKVLEIKSDGVLLGFIVVDSFRNELSFGGCRILNDLKKEEVQELAHTMTKKLFIHGLPIGGSKGGVIANAGGMEIDDILYRFGQSARGILDKSIIIGKDLGATNDRIAMIYKGLGSRQLAPVQRNFPKSVLPEFLNGLKGYLPNMTALGVMYTTLAATGREDLKGVRVAIQGAGAVGRGAFFRFQECGATVVGMSDIENSVSNNSGLKREDVEKGIQNGKIDVKCFEGSAIEPSQSLLTTECDVLVLAAGSNTVDGQVAKNIKANYIIEGSNFGLKLDARDELFERSVVVVPDIIASSSSAAMVCSQMGSGDQIDPEKLWKNIKLGIFKSTQACLEISKHDKISIRNALNKIYLPRIASEFDFQWGAEIQF